MTFLAYAVAAWLFVIGLFGIVTSRHLVHLTVSLAVAQSSTYLLLLSVGYLRHGSAPIDCPAPRRAKDSGGVDDCGADGGPIGGASESRERQAKEDGHDDKHDDDLGQRECDGTRRMRVSRAR